MKLHGFFCGSNTFTINIIQEKMQLLRYCRKELQEFQTRTNDKIALLSVRVGHKIQLHEQALFCKCVSFDICDQVIKETY